MAKRKKKETILHGQYVFTGSHPRQVTAAKYGRIVFDAQQSSPATCEKLLALGWPHLKKKEVE